MGRKYEQALGINATPEAVWKAVAEAGGIQSWFAPEARVEPGKSIWVSWGPGAEGESKIEVWEPNRRLSYSYERPSGRGPNVVEFTIDAKPGAATILRLVNSGFGEDESFDNEIETTAHAWPLFMLLLKHGVERGYRACRNISSNRMIAEPREEAWRRIFGSLKLDGEQLYFDAYGEACYELRAMNGALLALFCEPGGESTMLTVMCVLYDATEAEAAQARALVDSIGS